VLTPGDVVGASLEALLSHEPAEPDDETPEEGADEESPGPPALLLVVDQFEEAFTALDGPARAEFVAAVVAVARTGRVVLTLRSDFYGRCAEHPELADLVTANTVLVRPMTGAELRQAVLAPAAGAGLRVEEALVDHLVSDAARVNGSLAHVAAS